VSQQIRRLEQELGVEVFRRTSRSVALTLEGRMILGYAKRVVAEVDGMHRELEELSGLLSGQLRIGGVYPTGRFDLFGLLADFRGAHPGVAVHMVKSTQEDVLAALRRRAGLRVRGARSRHAHRRVRGHAALGGGDRGRAAVGHPLCARQRVTFAELAAEDLIAYRDNSALRRRLERTMAERQLEPHNAFECTEMAAVRGLASKGLGVAVMPRSAAEQPGPLIELRPVGPERLTWPIALVWRVARSQSPAGSAFIAVALEYAKRTGRARLRAA
jgi:DNA-binding transcriptional LysR family regulator